MATPIIVTLSGDSRQMSRDLRNARRDIKNFAGTAGKILKGFGLASAAALALTGGALLKTGLEAQGMQSTIARATGASGKELADMSAAAIDAMGQLPDAGPAVAKTFGELKTLLGGTNEDVAALTVGFHDLARVTKEDATTIASSWARAANSFGEVVTAGDDLDVLTVITQKYGVGLTALTGQVQRYGAVWKNAGFGMLESANIMGQLHAAGIDVSRVMPGINKAMRNWADEGKDGRVELEKSIVAIRNMTDDTEALSAATELFGAEGAQRILAAIRSGLDVTGKSYDDFAAQSEGALQRVTSESLTWREVWGEMTNSVQADIAGKLLPVMTELTHFVATNWTDWRDRAAEMIGQVTTLAEVYGEKLAPGVAAAWVFMEPFVGSVKEIGESNSAEVLAALGTALGVLGTIKVVSMFGSLATVLAGAVTPIGLVVGGLAALAAGLVWAYENVEPFRKAIEVAFSWIGEFMGNVFAGDWAAAWDMITAAAGTGWENIKAAGASAVEKMPGWGEAIGEFVDEAVVWFGSLSERLPDWGLAIHEWLGVAIDTAFGWLTTTAPRLEAWAIQFGTWLRPKWDQFREWFDTLPDRIFLWASTHGVDLGESGGNIAAKLVIGIAKQIALWAPLFFKSGGTFAKFVIAEGPGLVWTGLKIAAAMIVGVVRYWKEFIGTFSEVVGGWLYENAPGWQEAGITMMKEIGRGMIDQAWKVLESIRNLFTTGLANVAGVFGVGSGGGVGGFAAGGIISRPTLAMIGERGPEAIVPVPPHYGSGGIDRLPAGGGVTNIFQVDVTVEGDVLAGEAELGEKVVGSLRAFIRYNGPIEGLEFAV